MATMAGFYRLPASQLDLLRHSMLRESVHPSDKPNCPATFNVWVNRDSHHPGSDADETCK